MTFGVSRDRGRFEWSGTGPGIFAQRENIFKPTMWRMIFDIIRFNQFALDLLGDEIPSPNGHIDVANGTQSKNSKAKPQQSIGEYLKQEGYSQAFTDDYLIPMTAAVWSTSPDKASLDFPAITLVRFMWNHHLLSTIAARPDWLTIEGGSQRYIDTVLASSDKNLFHVHTSSPVTQVKRRPGGPTQVSYGTSTKDDEMDFDHVIFACHGDDILPLLTPSQSASPIEEDILGVFQTTENVAYLHSDLSLMPKRRAVWTAWNYLTTSAPSKLEHPAGVALTYWMNLLQHIPEEKYGPVLVTMNPPHTPDAKLIQGKFVYRHPLYTSEAVQAQQDLESIQNVSGISYCGAWTKYGFHEDGFSSGLKVAIEHLGAKLPFDFVDSTFSRGKAPVHNTRDKLVRIIILVIQRIIELLEGLLRFPPIALAISILERLVSSSSRAKIE